MNRHSFIVCCAIALLTAPGIVRGQDQPALIKLRLAQNFERNGEWEKAASLYETLFLGSPENVVYFDGLRRGLTQLKQYDKAIDLIKYWMSNKPDNPSLRTELGGVYYLKGDEHAADSIWQRVIVTDPKNAVYYRLVAMQLMEFRLYDRAIQLFLKAREATGNQSLFTHDLATLYTAFQQYDEATREYVSLLDSQPQQLSSIQSYMSMMVTRPEALATAQRVVTEEIGRRKESIPLRQLSAWLSMEAKQYHTALDQYRMIDQLKKAAGAELFGFAQQAAQEKAYEVAAQAFKEVIDRYPSNPNLPLARFGFARAREEAVGAIDTTGRLDSEAVPAWPVSETKQGFGGIIQLYNDIIHDYPRSAFAAQSYLRLGIIKEERLFDLDGAFSAFNSVRTIMPSHPLATEAALNIGKVLTAKNDLAGARREYSKLLAGRKSDIHDHAVVALAELDYYEGRYDSAEAKLKTFTESSESDLANNALQFLFFIQENSKSSGLADFALADLHMRQRKYSESLAEFRECIKRHPQALFNDDATLKTGEILLLMGKPAEALEAFREVAGMPMSIIGDRAQMRLGEVYETRMRDNEKAIKAYEELLVKFPRSLFVEQARNRIRMLRGDVL